MAGNNSAYWNLEAQNFQSQQLLEAQQLQSRQQTEAQKLQIEAMQAHATDSIHLHTELATAQERLKQMPETADLKAQLACHQQPKSSSADIQPNIPGGIQGAQKTTHPQATQSGHQTGVVSVTLLPILVDK